MPLTDPPIILQDAHRGQKMLASLLINERKTPDMKAPELHI